MSYNIPSFTDKHLQGLKLQKVALDNMPMKTLVNLAKSQNNGNLSNIGTIANNYNFEQLYSMAKIANSMNADFLSKLSIASKIYSGFPKISNLDILSKINTGYFGTIAKVISQNNKVFSNNLFSDEALNSFIKASSFPKDEILKMNYAFRNFNIDIATNSTFTKSIDSSHPIDEPKNNGYTDEFKRIMDNHVVTPSKELINVSSKTIFVETIADFVLRLAHQDPVNTSVYIWVLFFSYFGYLISKDNDDIKTNH